MILHYKATKVPSRFGVISQIRKGIMAFVRKSRILYFYFEFCYAKRHLQINFGLVAHD